MKVRFLVTVESKVGRIQEAVESSRKMSELSNKAFPKAEWQIFHTTVGAGETMYAMADFENMAALEAYLQKEPEFAAEAWKYADSPAVAVKREILAFD